MPHIDQTYCVGFCLPSLREREETTGHSCTPIFLHLFFMLGNETARVRFLCLSRSFFSFLLSFCLSVSLSLSRAPLFVVFPPLVGESKITCSIEA